MKTLNLNEAISDRTCSAALRVRSSCLRPAHLAWLAFMLLAPVAGAAPGRNSPPPAPPVTFAVLSDLHYYDTRLGTSGAAFEHYLAADPKLLHLSQPILESAMSDLVASGVQFVLISGDLTKDGERTSHELLVRNLAELEEAGIQVFVVPGNHDINNKDAVEYRGTRTIPVPGVSQSQFETLYRPFGYGEALAHAPDSLSYVAEPVPGVWLLALDSTKAKESIRYPVPRVSGRLSAATLAWAVQQIGEAELAGKKVIAFMHHGVNPHFLAEPEIFPDYLVDDWPMVGWTLAGAGLRVVFTGHYHAQDASNWTLNESFAPVPIDLYDIETSSLAGYPCAYRVASLTSAGELAVTTRRVTAITGMGPAPEFQAYAETFFRTLLPYQVTAELQYLFGITPEEAALIEPLVTDALVANFAGNEDPSLALLMLLEAMMTSGDEMMVRLGTLLFTLWVDLPPGNDYDVTVNL